jgi:hypothetical protein
MVESFNPQERELIERLRRAPQPSLPPESVAAIRARVLDALDLPPAAPPSVPPLLLPIIVLVVAAAIVIALIISRPPETPALAETPAPPSSTPTASLTPTQTATASATTSPTPTFTVTPSSTPAPTITLSAVVVIEGPVERIDGDILVIYGIEVLLPGDNLYSGVIEVGDLVRVEGDPDDAGVIVVVSITVINLDVNVNPGTGESWRDDGTCSNPPPDWAPANGWRRRCQGGANPGSGNPGQGQGNSQSDDDDDDDDDD